MQITVRFDGKDRCVAAIEKIKNALIDATKEATGEVGKELQRMARANFVGSHPPGYPHIGGDKPNFVSGNLAQSVTVLPVVAEGYARFSVTVGPTAIYARIIELGGTITPQEAEYLSWFSPWLGRRMYRKEVSIPAYKYFEPAFDQVVAHMNDTFASQWRDALAQ